MLLSVLILSCDPDEAKKKPTNTQDQDKDDKSTKPTKPTEPNKPTKPEPPPKPLAPINSPVASLGAISDNAQKDASDTGWVFQGKEITFNTTAKDKNDKEIPNAQFIWYWRKRDQDTDRGFGKSWTEIKGQTTATATLTIPANERVGAYQLRVSATSGKKTKESAIYKFTVRKSSCPAPSATNQPADNTAIKALLRGKIGTPGTPPLTDTELIRAIDTSQVNSLGSLFYNQNFNKDINCWDVSNVDTMVFMFTDNSMFNRDIGDWDTSQVTDMGGMFENASKFNQDISRWDTSQVTNMSVMFSGAAKFNQDLSGWDVSKGPFRSRFANGTTDWTEPKPTWP